MINFKQWINEIVEPVKPKNRVVKQNLWKSPQTNNPKRMIQYKFVTSLGNVVKVQFVRKDSNEYDVVFYVNDKLDDKSSQSQGTNRDAEILPGVVYIINTKAEKLGATIIHFEAWKSEYDKKVLYKIDIQKAEDQAELELNKFEQIIKSFPVKMIEPSPDRIALFQKFKMGNPMPLPDLDTKKIISQIDELKMHLKSKQMNNHIYTFIDNLYAIDWKKFSIDVSPLIKKLKELEGAWLSHTERGWELNSNRREAVYDKLIDRHLKGWNIQKQYGHYTLTKK